MPDAVFRLIGLHEVGIFRLIVPIAIQSVGNSIEQFVF